MNKQHIHRHKQGQIMSSGFSQKKYPETNPVIVG